MKIIQNTIIELLSEMKITPVLVDVGASLSPPEIWDSIAPHSIYIGFDPDIRDLQEIKDGKFRKVYIINKAVTDGSSGEQTDFYFTDSPYCSSTLPPDADALEDWLFAPLFKINHEKRVKATTLNQVADRLDLERVDWIKTDSQGTDLRILTALTDNRWQNLLAVDIEPGLIDAYQGEDLFTVAHQHLTVNGFWLSDMTLGQCIRMRPSTLEILKGRFKNISATEIERQIRTTPGWTNARYLKTIQSFNMFTEEQFVLSWIFACMDNQLGFALDIGLEFEKKYGNDQVAQKLVSAPLSALKVDTTC